MGLGFLFSPPDSEVNIVDGVGGLYPFLEGSLL